MDETFPTLIRAAVEIITEIEPFDTFTAWHIYASIMDAHGYAPSHADITFELDSMAEHGELIRESGLYMATTD